MKKIQSNIIPTIILVFISLIFNGQEIYEDKTFSPYFFIETDDPSIDCLPLKSTVAEVIISGVMADVNVIQTYENTGEKALEAIYIFPGSTRSAVYAMQMTMGERIIKAEVKEKQQAREDYENALEEGRTASLLEQHRPNVFQMNVGNILPGDIISVEMKYTELLIPENGVYEFVYPTVVGPRYGSNMDDMNRVSDPWIANPYTKEGMQPFAEFDINIILNTGIPIEKVKSTSHDVNIKFTSPETALISLRGNDKHSGNKDYILQYGLKGNAIESGIIFHEGDEENFFLAMIQPPQSIKEEQIPPREYIFIMDVSGSMSGFPLDISKNLIKDLLENLQPTDQFNILFFAGGSETLSDHSLKATPDNINKAINFVDNQRGGGGTELLPALKKALKLEISDDYSRTFVIATDGYVTVEKEAFDLIRENLGNANFFPFGIGSSVNRYLLEGMAHVGQGNPYVATNQQEAIIMAEKFRKVINTPVLTNIKYVFDGFDAYDIEPLTIPDVFAEKPVIIFGKYRNDIQGTLKIKGKTGTKDYMQILNLAQEKKLKNNPALKYLWARESIKLLDDYANVDYAETNELKITALGLKYNLLTSYTSFIAIDSEIRNEDGEMIVVKQPLPLPDGVSNNAIGSYAKTSTKGLGLFKKNTQMSLDRSSSAPAVAEDELEIEEGFFNYSIDVSPEYIEGEAALQKFIDQHIIYPEVSLMAKIEGTVYLSFTVTADGNIRDIEIILGINEDLDQEAVRVITLTSGKWKPAMQNSVPVECNVLLPVNFSVNSQKSN